MNIADLLVTLGGVIFNVALIPTVIYQARARASTVSLGTSITTAVACGMLLGAYVSLGLWFGAATLIVNLSLWGIVAVQRVVYES